MSRYAHNVTYSLALTRKKNQDQDSYFSRITHQNIETTLVKQGELEHVEPDWRFATRSGTAETKDCPKAAGLL